MHLPTLQLQTLKRLLRIRSNETIASWRKNGYIRALPRSPGNTQYFLVAHIDEVLRRNSHNFKVPLTVRALFSKEIVLLTPAEVCAELAINIQMFRLLLAEEVFEVLNIRRTLLVSKASVLLAPQTWLDYLHITQKPVTDWQLSIFFGTRVKVLRSWDVSYPDWRTCKLHPHTGTELYPICVVGVLQRYMAKNSSPQMWLKNRQQGLTTVTLQVAAKALGMSTEQVIALSIEGKLEALHWPNGRWRYAWHTIAARIA